MKRSTNAGGVITLNELKRIQFYFLRVLGSCCVTVSTAFSVETRPSIVSFIFSEGPFAANHVTCQSGVACKLDLWQFMPAIFVFPVNTLHLYLIITIYKVCTLFQISQRLSSSYSVPVGCQEPPFPRW